MVLYNTESGGGSHYASTTECPRPQCREYGKLPDAEPEHHGQRGDGYKSGGLTGALHRRSGVNRIHHGQPPNE